MLVVGAAFLVVPPYVNYCQQNYADEKYCAAHETVTLFVAFFQTYNGAITALATVVIAGFTWTLWEATDKLRDAGERQIEIAEQMASAASDANKSVREIERAYLTSGGAAKKRGRNFKLDVANYGKTAAYLTEYAVVICDAKEVGPIPRYLLPGYKRVTFSDRIAPMGGGKTIELGDYGIVPQVPNPIVYGRVWYQDIWKDEHIFSFILAIREDRTHPNLSDIGLADIAEAYTEWT